MRFHRFYQLNDSVKYGYIPVRRRNVDMIRLEYHPVFSLEQLHLGGFLDQFRHYAYMIRIQMGYYDKGHTGILGQILEESVESVQAACRCTDADNIKRTLSVWHFGGNSLFLERRRLRNRFLFHSPC